MQELCPVCTAYLVGMREVYWSNGETLQFLQTSHLFTMLVREEVVIEKCALISCGDSIALWIEKLRPDDASQVVDASSVFSYDCKARWPSLTPRIVVAIFMRAHI